MNSQPNSITEKPASHVPSLGELEQASHELKQKIEEQRRKTAMPINPALGDPEIDARNADGHNDLPPDDED